MEKIIEFLKERKRLFLIVILVVFALLLILFSAKGSDTSTQEALTLSEYKAELEKELSELCSRVDGVGKCYVTVSFLRGEQVIYKGSKPSEVKPPEVLGVTVVCKGAESDLVKASLTDMMCALFGIGANRVAVLKLS